jgi:hypothetical protein
MSRLNSSFKEISWLDPFQGLEANKAKLKLACPGRARSAMKERPRSSAFLNLGSLISKKFEIQPLKLLINQPFPLTKSRSSPEPSVHETTQDTPDFSFDKGRRLKTKPINKRILRPTNFGPSNSSNMRPMKMSGGRTSVRSQGTKMRRLTGGAELLECSFGFSVLKQVKLN